MYTYKTKDGSKNGFVPRAGKIVDGVIQSPKPLENPNLVLVTEQQTPAAPVQGPVNATPSQTQTVSPAAPIEAAAKENQ